MKINFLLVTSPITWSKPADVAYRMPLSNTQLNAYSSVTKTFVHTPLSGTLMDASDHTWYADFKLYDASNYSDASKNITIIVLTPVQKIHQMIILVKGLVT